MISFALFKDSIGIHKIEDERPNDLAMVGCKYARLPAIMKNPPTASQPDDATLAETDKNAPTAARYPLSEESVRSLMELGEILKQIHARLLSDGYVIRDGMILEPKSSDTKNGIE